MPQKIKPLSLICTLLSIFYTHRATSQNSTIDYDFDQMDSLSRTMQYKGDLKLLVNELTRNLLTDTQKARAIFVWVADNIAYDYKAINNNKRPKPFGCNGKNCTDKYARWEEKLLSDVLDNKKAICSGYAALFKKMCDYAGLRTDIVPGYIKNDDSHIGKMGILDHAWNGILLDDKYYFLDVTWAAGGCGKYPDGKLMPFHKYFNDYYWLTPPGQFMRDHFPADKKHPLIMNGSIEKYRDAPYIRQEYMSNIEVLSHDSGIIEACKGDTLHFKILFRNFLWSKIQVNTNIKPNPNPWKFDGEYYYLDEGLLEKQQYVEHTFNNYIFEFDYVLNDSNVRYLDILFDHHRMIRFKIKMLK